MDLSEHISAYTYRFHSSLVPYNLGGHDVQNPGNRRDMRTGGGAQNATKINLRLNV